MNNEWTTTLSQLTTQGKGLLAADESSKTIEKRFAAIHVDCTEENRRTYRELLFTAPNLEKYISGVILFEETLQQKTMQGIPFPTYLTQKGIVPGIKVDTGLIPFESSSEEQITQGLDGLSERLTEYKKQGAKFAKWRAVYQISGTTPSRALIKTNAMLLARYAKICQNLSMIPIVEPEVLIDGNHTIEQCAEITEKVQRAVFKALFQYHVQCEYMLLKPSMVISGKACASQANIDQVAELTVRILRRTVPAAVPSINFLSGGQSDKIATAHLNRINQQGVQPWSLSFSYARALQEACLKTWRGKSENIPAAQLVLIKRAQLNSAASLGKCSESME